MRYEANFLNNIDILTQKQKDELKNVSNTFSLNNFLCNARLVEKIGFDFIYSSSQIEGNTYTKSDTLTLIENGLTAGGKMYSDAKMILNLKNAFDEILSNEMDISKNTLHKLHFILSEDLVLKYNRGTMRTTNIDGISGTNYQPLPTGEILNTEMKFVFSQYHKIKNPFEKAIYLHNNLCYLQYFEDCNKRTARAMQFLSMKNDNLMPLVLIDDDKKIYSDYRDCIIKYYETGNHSDYINFFIDNYKKEMNFFCEYDMNNIEMDINSRDELKHKIRKQR